MILKAKQLTTADDVANAVLELLKPMRAHFDKLRAANLHEQADRLEAAHSDLYMHATRLKQDAHDTFFAALRGEELPK